MAAVLLCSPFAGAQTPEDVPEVVRELLERGQRLQDDGRHDDAIEAFEDARELSPSVVESYLGLGAARLATGDTEASLEAFAAGLAVAPDHRNLLFNAAVVGLRLNRLDRAVGWTAHALDVHRDDVELHVVHATVLSRLDRDAEALEALEAADRLSPRTPSILFRLGNQLHKVGDSERAARAFRDAIARDRKMLRAHYNLGAVLFELERDDEALEAYGIALEPFDELFRSGSLPEPIHAQAYANLGAIHTRRQDWSAALAAYDKALRLQPERTAWLYNRGFVHFRAGHEEAARDDYTAALARDTDLPLAYLHLGQLDRRAGDCSAAVGRLEQGLDRFDTRQRLAALEMMAFCYTELGRPDQAETAFRDVLDASPDDPELLLGLGRLLRRQGQSDEARALLDRSLDLRRGHLPTQ
ncbi:MAG: tetratricopeptide repeat protein, partial [Acidobacteriota bacterium]